jgi:hypothetical protein
MTTVPMLAIHWTPLQSSLDAQIERLMDIGANSVVIPNAALSEIPFERLKHHNIAVFVDWKVFMGEALRQRYPDSVPIDASGMPFDRDDWYVPICPNHPGVRAEHLRAIPGLWLDFIRFPVRWETRQPHFRQMCFCRHCLNLFLGEQREQYSPEETRHQARLILRERAEEWVDWKCIRIEEFVLQVRERLAARHSARGQSGQERAPIRLGIFSVPWRRAEYNGALRAVAGQDLTSLARHVDVISPMVYHKLCGQPVEWIAEVVRDVQSWTNRPVLPVIQSLDRPDAMPPEELHTALATALGASDGGVMIFTLDPLLQSAAKAEVVRSWFRPATPR